MSVILNSMFQQNWHLRKETKYRPDFASCRHSLLLSQYNNQQRKNPPANKVPLCDIQININYYWQLYINCTDVQPFKTWVNLDFDPSRSFTVVCDAVIEFPIYRFLLMFNSTIWPNSAPLRDIRLINRSDLELDLSRSLKVKCYGNTGLLMYGFLLFNSNAWPNSEPFQDIRLSVTLTLTFQCYSITPQVWLPIHV